MTPDPSADLASIRRFVQVVENTQWQRNADAFLALFAPDAVWTNPMGRRLTGLDEISDFTRKGLKMSPPDVFATYEVEHVSFLGDDVAVVNVRRMRLPAPSRTSSETVASKTFAVPRSRIGLVTLSPGNGDSTRICGVSSSKSLRV